ncbi:hypothetical protein AYK26_04470 [Euryarchaeota archaeon SM23-78]|nr:MAG: hypothetical protein AYK26_04470 [Euryarchaeota archaeon SM23-78]
MKKTFLIEIVLLVLLPFFVNAATYYVAKDGSGDFTTIAAASNAAQPGDTIYIRAGTYSETIRPARSGTAGNPITYARYGNEQVTITNVGDGIDINDRNYIVIDGIRIVDVNRFVDMQRATHNIIKNCYMNQFSSWIGIFLWEGSDHNKILNNTILGPCFGGAEAGDLIYCYGGCHYNVIEDNYFEYGSHTTVEFRGQTGHTSNNVIRNNRVWNPWHTLITAWPAADYTLIEGNIILDGGEKASENSCGSDRDRTAPRKYHAGIQLGSENCIIRNNVLINNGWMEINSYPPEGSPPGPPISALNNRIYHNTFHKNHYGPASEASEPVDGNVFKNNIFYKQVSAEISMSIPSGTNYFINNDILGASYYAGGNDIWSGTLNENPLFVNENAVDDVNNKNFNEGYVYLQSSSPMIDAGAFLTKARSAGSGTNIPIEDASYFYDGWGIEGEVGDLIQLEEQSVTAYIVNVDYNSNTITVDKSLTWSSGTGVTLAYNGNAPDIGAYEYGGTTPPPPPPTCTNCKTNPCNTYNDCTTASGTCISGYCCQGTCTETSTCSKCKEQACNTYYDCAPGSGTCKTGYYCCQGTCTETPPQPPPPIGDELIVNGDFSSWSNDNPVGWTMEYSEGANNYITQSSGRCRLVDLNTGGARITQNILTPGKQYRVTYTLVSVNQGAIKVGSEDPWKDIIVNDNTPGTKTFDFTAIGTTFSIGRSGVPTDVIIDDVSVKDISSTQIPGDLNNDKVVDIDDITIVAINFGLSSGFDERADTDNNGIIDIFDIVFVASRFT